MWNLKSSNRILDQRQKQQAHLKHLYNLRNVKSSLNNGPPKQYAFLYKKEKTRQLAKQKIMDIDKKNNKLVNRMLTMPSTYCGIQNNYYKQSLNAGMLRKREKTIDEENYKLVRRLQNANSKYSQREISKSVNSYYKARSNMAFSRMDPYYDMDMMGVKKTSIESFNRTQGYSQKLNARPCSAKK